MGLNDIQMRMNDHINLVLDDLESESTLELLNEHYRLTSIKEEAFFDFLTERGLSRHEALRYIDLYYKRKEYMTQEFTKVNLVHCTGFMITWAKK